MLKFRVLLRILPYCTFLLGISSIHCQITYSPELKEFMSFWKLNGEPQNPNSRLDSTTFFIADVDEKIEDFDWQAQEGGLAIYNYLRCSVDYVVDSTEHYDPFYPMVTFDFTYLNDKIRSFGGCTFDFDTLSRPTCTTCWDSTTPTGGSSEVLCYWYDEKNLIDSVFIEAESFGGTWATMRILEGKYAYDSMDRPNLYNAREIRFESGWYEIDTAIIRWEYDYDSLNQRTIHKLEFENEEWVLKRIEKVEYNSDGFENYRKEFKITETDTLLADETTFERDSINQLTSEIRNVYYNTGGLYRNYTTSYRYIENGRISEIEYQRFDGQDELLQHDKLIHTYNEFGFPIERVLVNLNTNSFMQKAYKTNYHYSDASDCMTTSIKDHHNTSSLTIFPNPTNNQLELKAEMLPNKTVEIYSLEGQAILHSQALNTIDVSFLNPGMYILILTDRNSRQQEYAKFIKN